MSAIALITGASGGIGRALARQLQSQGCRVAAVGRDIGRLADVEATVRIAADSTTPASTTARTASRTTTRTSFPRRWPRSCAGAGMRRCVACHHRLRRPFPG